MAVVGVDFGTLHSKIGVARFRGIDIITNEVSNRATPSLVAFGPKQRAIGEPAKTQEISNFKNTVGSLKRLIGRTISDPEIENVEKKYMNAKLVDVQGTVGVQVNYVGEQQAFSATQLVAMYFGKLRDIAGKELKNAVTDIVIAIPGWFTDIQRRAVLDAAQIAGLNVLRLINDTTAVALGYGITKSDLPAEGAKHVVFVDIGHSSLSVAVVAFARGKLVVKSVAFDRHVGGRDIDYALVQYFAEEFKGKYKIDVMSNPKATFRLATGCERLKKILSANAEAPLSVESIMNDVDAQSKLTREQLEGLIAHVLDRIPGPLQTALEESELTLDQIDSIELVGGSTRIPAVRSRIQQVFPGKTLSTTLNQDEAVARGATFACAMASPVFRVREFHITDIAHFPIKVQWPPIPSDPDHDTELLVFPKGNTIPSTKILSFERKESFDIEAVYAEPDKLPGGINPWVGKFTAKQVPASPDGDATTVKLKVRLNTHGVMSFDSAYIEEIEEKEMDVDPPADGAAAPPKKKKKSKKDIPFISGFAQMDKSIIESLREQENQMHASDKLVMDTEYSKNALEEYVYDTRGKLDDRYAAFVQPAEKEKLLVALQEAEDWLYSDEGEDATKSAYIARLDALKKLGDPITFRWREFEDRHHAVSQLRDTLNTYHDQASSTDEKYAHIEDKDKASVLEKVATVQKWLDDAVAKQAERPKNADPVLTKGEIEKKRDEVIYFATPIMTKPKPKPPYVPTPAGSGTATPNADGKSGTRTHTPAPEPADANMADATADQKKAEGGEKNADGIPLEMDVD